MTLSTHSVVGASIAVLSGVSPVTACILGFGSHFILDSIPHWDYKVNARNVGTDIAIGFILVVYFFLFPFQSFATVLTSSVVWGAFGAVLPDLLIGFHVKFPTKLIGFLHYFHIDIMHSKTRLDHRVYLGVFMQACVITIALCIVQYYAQI